MPIRIMHVVDSLGKGGLENGLVNVIERLDPTRFEHIVFAMRALGPNAVRLPRDRVRLECLGKKPGSRIQIGALARALRKFEPDIVHSRNWSAIEAVLAGRLVRTGALVHSEHGVESEAIAEEPRRRIYFRRLAYALADRVFSVSYQLRDLHSRRTGFPARRIDVIHNGVDSRRFFADSVVRTRMRRELGLGESDFCIGCVGNLLPVKDHLTLLRAAAAIVRGRSDVHFVLIGEGPERPRLEAFVDAHPECRTQVRFLGSSNRVSELLNAMDTYVLPSMSEGISNSLLEAMATGLPVVATATGGNPEVVVDGESGLLFPVSDSAKLAERLLLLERCPDLCTKLARQAVCRVHEQFSIEAMIQRYEQLYEGLVPALAAPMRAPVRV